MFFTVEIPQNYFQACRFAIKNLPMGSCEKLLSYFPDSQDSEVQVSLEAEQWDDVGKALGELKFKDAAPIIHFLRGAIMAQKVEQPEKTEHFENVEWD